MNLEVYLDNASKDVYCLLGKQYIYLYNTVAIKKPGTPLNMEVYLDNASKDVYGLLGKQYIYLYNTVSI